jgi:hypothetical protein
VWHKLAKASKSVERARTVPLLPPASPLLTLAFKTDKYDGEQRSISPPDSYFWRVPLSFSVMVASAAAFFLKKKKEKEW